MMPDFPAYLSAFAQSEVGAVRKRNEDAFASDLVAGLFFVADGMGGGSAGDEASRCVCRHVAVAVRADDSPGLRKYSVQQSIHAANREIAETATARKYRQMGSTLALFLADPWDARKALLCHVGDSRIYRVRKNTLKQLTRDHSVGEELRSQLAKRGEDAAADKKLARLLTQAIGDTRRLHPTWQETDLRAGDRYLICTDGVSGMIGAEGIATAFHDSPTAECVAAKLVRDVMRAGAKDNFTFIVLDVGTQFPDGYQPSGDELAESDYMLKIAEERNDNA